MIMIVMIELMKKMIHCSMSGVSTNVTLWMWRGKEEREMKTRDRGKGKSGRKRLRLGQNRPKFPK